MINSFFNPFPILKICSVIISELQIEIRLFQKTGLTLYLIDSKSLPFEESYKIIFDYGAEQKIDALYIHFIPFSVPTKVSEHVLDSSSPMSDDELNQFIQYLHQTDFEEFDLLFQLFGSENESVYSQAIPKILISLMKSDLFDTYIVGLPNTYKSKALPVRLGNLSLSYEDGILNSVVEDMNENMYNSLASGFNSYLKIDERNELNESYNNNHLHSFFLEYSILDLKSILMSNQVNSSSFSNLKNYFKQTYPLLFTISFILIITFGANFFTNQFFQNKISSATRSSKNLIDEINITKSTILSASDELNRYSTNDKKLMIPILINLSKSLSEESLIQLKSMDIQKEVDKTQVKLNGLGDFNSIQKIFESLQKQSAVSNIEYNVATKSIDNQLTQEFNGSYSVIY